MTRRQEAGPVGDHMGKANQIHDRMTRNMMKAAVLAGPEKIEVRDVPVPKVEQGNMKIRVSSCGVCGSDIHMWKVGKGWSDEPIPDFRMGHEFCGVVEDPGQSQFMPGDRVTFWANLYCGKCDMCQIGKEHLCREVHGKNYIGFVSNGAYAEYFAGPYKNAYKLPDGVSDISAALIDPLMVAYHAVKHSRLRLFDKTLIVGSGIIAQLMGTLAKKAGASVVAMSIHDYRQLDKSREIGDIDIYFEDSDKEEIAKLLEYSKGGFDVVFEAVGSQASIQTAIDAVKPGGEIVVIGNSTTPTIPFDLNSIVLHEITFQGSVSCTRREFEETIALIDSGFINPEKYVTDIVNLDGLQAAFRKQIDPNAKMLKTVLVP